MVDKAIVRQPRLARFRSELIQYLQRAAATAHDAGATYAASLVKSRHDSALEANVLVQILPIAGASGDGPPAGIAELASLLSTDEDQPAEIGIVELPVAGTAVRVRGRGPVAVDLLASPVEMLSVQYFVGVPGSHMTAALTCTSPSLSYEEALVAMFDAVATTFGFADAEGRWVTAASQTPQAPDSASS